MNTIKRQIKKFILRKLIKKCELKEFKLNLKMDKIRKDIVMFIIKGGNEVKIKKLQIYKDELFDKQLAVVSFKWKACSALRRA